jgi:alpha-1,2-mannosyltransferase
MDNIFREQSMSDVVLTNDSIFSFLMKISIGILTFTAILIYILYKSGRQFSQRFFTLPPTEFRQVISKALESQSGIIPPQKIGIKKAAYRRRLIMGALKPQLYSTLPLNSRSLNNDKIVNNLDSKYYKLRISQIDKLTENKDNFLKNIKPILPNNIERKKLFGFFHPLSYALGGGEKVLWEAVISTLETDESNIVIIYTLTPSNESSVYSILKGVKDTFGIDFLTTERENLRDRIVFIHLPDKWQWLITGNSFKFLSMLGQAIGSIILVFIGFQQIIPDIFIDTIGIPFSYLFIYGLLDIPIISYIHYPAVSKDMLNAAKMMGGIYGILKFVYWWILLKLYSFNIMWVDTILFNSTWTGENVISALGWVGEQINIDENILYPPCVNYDDENFDKISINDILELKREKCITYLAQFRPEKRHSLLLKHYKEYLNKFKEINKNDEPHKLILIGSVRPGKDEEFINNLKKMVIDLEIPSELIIFELNAPNETVNEWLKISDFGINCMWKEHFGIAVVEYMLNGAIPLVHASAGPLEDIVIPRINGKVLNRKDLEKISKIEDTENSGLFFKDETDPDFNKSVINTYSTLTEMLLKASTLSQVDKSKIRENAVIVAREKFGKRAFASKWKGYIYDIGLIETERRSNRGKVEQSY